MNNKPSNAQLTCPGFEWDGCQFPRFELRAGEILRLRFPQGSHVWNLFENETILKRELLTSEQGERKGIAIQKLLSRPRWKEYFHRQNAIERLTSNTNLSHADAEAYLRDVEIDPKQLTCTMARNPHAMIELACMLSARPCGFVFHTMGMDPLGVQRMLRTVFDKVDDASAIYCQTAVTTQRQTVHQECDFPFVDTLDVARDATSPVQQRVAG